MQEYIPIEKLGSEVRKKKVKDVFGKIQKAGKQIIGQDFSIGKTKKRKGLFDF